jgi:hypothetical protein
MRFAFPPYACFVGAHGGGEHGGGEHGGVDAQDQHFLVIRAVENGDFAAFGQGVVRAPEEIVFAFLLAGLLETCDVAALRIDAGHDVGDGAVLSGGIHALDDDQQRVAGGGVETLLQFAQAADVVGQLRLIGVVGRE